MSGIWNAGASWGLLFVRLGVGLVFLFHGYPKMTGRWADGKGSRESLKKSLKRLGLPQPHYLAIVVGTIEFCGGLMVMAGLATRLVSLFLVIIMLVASTRNFVEKGFLGGADFPFSLLMTLVGLILLGSGSISADALLFGP